MAVGQFKSTQVSQFWKFALIYHKIFFNGTDLNSCEKETKQKIEQQKIVTVQSSSWDAKSFCVEKCGQSGLTIKMFV